MSRILVVGAGGVGASMASIAESRTFFEVFVLADINEQRCVDALKNLDNPDRFLTAKVDANNKDDLVALARAHKIDIIVNACDPRLNDPIFEAAFEAGCTYVDMAMNLSKPHATNPYNEVGEPLGAAQLAVRIVGSIGRIDQSHLRTGKLTDDEWPRLTEAIEKLRTISLHIDESAGLTSSELRANARRLSRQCGKLGLIVVDYLQLMSGSSSDGENRATELGEISRGLKTLAKELQCPVIALSQLNRSVETRPDKRPMMSDLRESGAIEQDADIIMFIYRDEYYTKDACKEPGVAEVIIAKQRNGPTGTVKLAFLKPITKFESLASGGSGDF